MSARGPLPRLALGLLFLVAAALAVVGGVAIRGTGLVAVLLAAVVAGCVAAGMAREAAPVNPRQAGFEAACRAVGWTVGGLLVVSGAGAVAGAGAAGLVVLVGAAALVVRAVLARRRGRQPSTVVPFPGPSGSTAGPGWPADLTVAELGRAWVRSSAALSATRDPVARARLVSRRQQALDELERRDPDGFARWLAAGATIDSDPARWVASEPPSSPASGSEAA